MNVFMSDECDESRMNDIMEEDSDKRSQNEWPILSGFHPKFYKVNHKKRLGKGAFGIVYQGDQDPNNNPDLPEKIAVKEIDIENKYCETELELLKYNFNFNHKNLVSIYFMSRPSDSTFEIYMEYCECTLKQEIDCRNKKNEKLEDKEVIHVVRQILQGTKYLHSRKIIHRDLKPSNLLLKRELKSDKSLLNCIVKVGDFGLSKSLEFENRNTMSHQHLGSTGYRPPEACTDAMKRRWDEKGDIWSIGKIFLKITTRLQYTNLTLVLCGKRKLLRSSQLGR